jgi:outer membrane protein assembly factor BamB
MRLLAALLVATLVPAASPPVRATSLPRTAVVGSAWQVTLRAAKAPTIVATGPATLRAKATGRAGVFRARLTFPRAGTWQVAAVLGKKTTRLGSVAVDIARDPLIVDPITIAAEPSGSLLVGQLREGELLRIADGRVTTAAQLHGLFHVAVANGTAYVAAQDGAVYRVDGSTGTRVTPQMDASAVAIDAAGNLYVTVYVGWIKKVARDGTVSTIAGNGTEGYSGDGGPATAAQIFHPHSIVVGRDGALYVADTENRRIRRIDLATGRISTFGGDVGITVALAVGPDGSIYSADIVRNGAGGGVTRTTPDGVTTRLLSSPTANGVAVTSDGTVYVNLWEEKRIMRLAASGRLEPVARG